MKGGWGGGGWGTYPEGESVFSPYIQIPKFLDIQILFGMFGSEYRVDTNSPSGYD